METATKRLVRFLAEYLTLYPEAATQTISFGALTGDDPDDTETLADLVKKADDEAITGSPRYEEGPFKEDL